MKSALYAPSWRPGGKSIAWVAIEAGTAKLVLDGKTLVAGEDVFPLRPTWLKSDEVVYTSNGKIWRRSRVERLRVDDRVLGDRAGDHAVVHPARARFRLARAAAGEGHRQPRAFARWQAHRVSGAERHLCHDGSAEAPQPLLRDRFYKCDPAWSPDGSRLAYSSDRNGTADIWIRDLASGTGPAAHRRAARRGLVHLVAGRNGDRVSRPDRSALHDRGRHRRGTQGIRLAVGTGPPHLESLTGASSRLAAFKPYSAALPRRASARSLVIERATGAATYTPGISEPLAGDARRRRPDLVTRRHTHGVRVREHVVGRTRRPHRAHDRNAEADSPMKPRTRRAGAAIRARCSTSPTRSCGW